MAVDVSIALKVDSLIPYVAVDRAMANPTDTIYFMNISASNEALESIGINEDVSANFKPLNTKVQLGNKVATIELGGTDPVTSFSKMLVKGTVTVTLIKGSKTVVGHDFAKDGVIYFDSPAAGSLTINYATGELTGDDALDSLDAGSVATAMVDAQVDSAGATILKVKPTWVNVQLATTPHQIILEENAQVAAYMQKIAQNTSRIAMTSDYTTLQFDRVVKTYKDSINREIIAEVVTATNAAIADSTTDDHAVEVDLSDYTVLASRNETRDDIVNGMIIDMKSEFLAKTTMEPTVIITGSKGAAELARNAMKWVRAPGFTSQLDGLAGTFDGTPVFRHHYVDTLDQAEKTAGTLGANDVTFYMAAKRPDNSSGSLAFGEFISLIKTPTAQNAANPFQMSTGFYSQVGTKVIQPNLFQKGIIKKA